MTEMARLRVEGAALIAAAALAGCAVAPPAPAPAPPERVRPVAPQVVEVLARNDDYVVVLPREGDDFAALAKRYLGDARRAW